jgi:leucyl/phenylalanyl-tRNA--protein transferase
MEGCAEPRDGQSGTWISSPVIDAYTHLHRMGYAHSIEAWRNGRLAGGLYGIAIGRMFFGESMFAREDDASKVALVHLAGVMKQRQMPLIDCQQETPHLTRFGARPISRRRFARWLSRLVDAPQARTPWEQTVEAVAEAQ